MGQEIIKRVCALNGCELNGFNITLGNRLRYLDIESKEYIKIIDMIYRQGLSEDYIICEACFSK